MPGVPPPLADMCHAHWSLVIGMRMREDEKEGVREKASERDTERDTVEGGANVQLS